MKEAKLTEITVRVIDCHVFRHSRSAIEYLMLKRSQTVMYPGIWQCVTGKIDAGEKPYETAIRELMEETGLSPAGMWTVDRVNHYYEAVIDRMNLIPIFGIEAAAGEVRLSREHVDFKWCTFENALDLLLWSQQKAGLRELHDMLTSDPRKLELTAIPLHAEHEA